VKYRFALVWMMLIPLSYYAFGNQHVEERTMLLFVQYVPVYGWFLFEFGVFQPIEKWWALKRAKVKEERLRSFLNQGQSVLEVGSGNGALSKILSANEMKLTALDIEDKTLFDEVSVQVYDGEKFPFEDKQFDVCQMITMLHHTTNAEQLIQESKRVAKHIIIMEDVYENAFQKYITWVTDSVVNWEFYGHPHTNRTDAEWRALFERNGLTLKRVEYYRFLLFFKQVTYVLEVD
jgi:SAM-dependent methyltransferase